MPERWEIISSYWWLLLADPDAAELLAPRPLITYKKGRSLKDRLVRSHYCIEQPTGMWLDCKSLGSFRGGNCSFCDNIERTRNFTSATTGRKCIINDFINCRSTGVICLATCTCQLDYVRKTRRELRRRIGEHLGNIHREVDTPFLAILRNIMVEMQPPLDSKV